MSNMSNIDETLEVINQVLIRCVVIGILVLLLWWGALGFMGDLTYSIHSKLTPVSRSHFNAIHYAGMLTTKAGVSLLFFFPYIAIRLVIKKRGKEISTH